MTNKEDQIVEVEALESIFPEIEVVETKPFHALRFTLKTEKYDDDPDNEAKIVLVFKFTEKYPDEGPDVEIEESENVIDEDDVLDFLKEQANENLGMPMLYTLVCALIEKLNKDNEDRKIFEENEKDRLERKREAEELKRFEGTKVTVEAFLKWKAAFDKEMNDLKKQAVDTGHKKPTGKQLFERDESLFTSDLQFDGDAVQVDESLFQELEDLDLDEEDDDDEDYEDDEDDEEEEE